MASASTSATPESTTADVRASQCGPIDIRLLGHHLDRIVRDSDSEQQATEALVKVVRQLTGSLAVLYYGNDSTGRIASDPAARDPRGVTQATLDQLYALADRAQQQSSVQIAQSGDGSSNVAIAVPVWRRDGRVEAMLALAAGNAQDRRRLAGWVQIMQFLSAYAGQWRGNLPETDGDSRIALTDPSQLIETLAHAAGAKSLNESAQCYANFIATQTSARFVAIGLRRRGGGCRLAALSGSYQFERGAPVTAWLETALGETLIAPDTPVELDDGRDTEAVSQLRSLLRSEYVYRIPLGKQGKGAIAALLLVYDKSLSSNELQRCQQLAGVLGPQLQLLRAAQPKGLRRVASWLDSLTVWRRRALYLGFIAVALALLAVPLPHRLKCVCEVQPEQRRYVAAPYDGRLEEALVEPGDVVKRGQVLARMDSREIETEISGVEAALAAVRGERQVAMSEGDTASARIALWQMKTLQVKLELLQNRLANLAVTSPTDGVVISGDPTNLEGAPLRMGQTLVEVGPLDNMFLEVAIADEDIAYAQTGRKVQFRLASTPFREYEGQLRRIHPRAEQRDGENVFVGEVEIADPLSLRPGMRGHARIAGDSRCLAWLILHRAIEQLLFRFGA